MVISISVSLNTTPSHRTAAKPKPMPMAILHNAAMGRCKGQRWLERPYKERVREGTILPSQRLLGGRLTSLRAPCTNLTTWLETRGLCRQTLLSSRDTWNRGLDNPLLGLERKLKATAQRRTAGYGRSVDAKIELEKDDGIQELE
jgi:hypothetical protein